MAEGQAMTGDYLVAGGPNNGTWEAGWFRGTEGEELTFRQEWQWRKSSLVVGQPVGGDRVLHSSGIRQSGR